MIADTGAALTGTMSAILNFGDHVNILCLLGQSYKSMVPPERM